MGAALANGSDAHLQGGAVLNQGRNSFARLKRLAWKIPSPWVRGILGSTSGPERIRGPAAKPAAEELIQ